MGKIGKIEDNIPLPEPRKIIIPSKYPWRDLEIGQSFLVTLDYEEKLNNLRAKLKSSMNNYRKRFAPEREFQLAVEYFESKDPEKKPTSDRPVPRGIRCWRIQ